MLITAGQRADSPQFELVLNAMCGSARGGGSGRGDSSVAVNPQPSVVRMPQQERTALRSLREKGAFLGIGRSGV